ASPSQNARSRVASGPGCRSAARRAGCAIMRVSAASASAPTSARTPPLVKLAAARSRARASTSARFTVPVCGMSGLRALDARLVEGAAEDPLGGADPVEVRRDATHLEGPAGAEDHAQVDILGRLDDVFVQHALDLVGQAVLDAQ